MLRSKDSHGRLQNRRDNVSHPPLTVLALAAVLSWLGLLLFRAAFWRARVDEHLGKPDDPVCERVRVEAIVPARNEAEIICETLPSLVGQHFSGSLRVTLVDDHSDDGTSHLARASLERDGAGQAASPDLDDGALGSTRREPGSARFSVEVARELSAGWTGKLNALDTGIQSILKRGGAPDYWFFTDADIRHDSDNLSSLVTAAEHNQLDLVSSMVKLQCATPAERLLVPAFIFFFQKLYPFAWVADRRKKTAAAAGGCVLLRHSALERIGGLSAISDRLIDDCALAAAVKGSGGAIRLGLTARATSARSYSLGDFWRMVKRTAFAQLNRSYGKLVFTVAGMAFLYATPPPALIAGIFLRDWALAALGASAWLAMAIAYEPTVRFYKRPLASASALPLSALLYTLMTIDSAIAEMRHHGGGWKGRTYSVGMRASG